MELRSNFIDLVTKHFSLLVLVGASASFFLTNIILIDGENSRILVINSLHNNNAKYKYNHKKLILDPFKNG